MFIILDSNDKVVARVDKLPDLTYDLSGLAELDKPRDERAPWPTISAVDTYGNRVSITTNRYGEGLFERLHLTSGDEYRQVSGTLQYRMPCNESRARYALKRRWLNRYVLDEHMFDAICQANEDAEEMRRAEEVWPL